MYKKYLTKEQALQKLKHFCGYQERSHADVVEKLYALGVWKQEHDHIISSLIEENYLNEERFAKAFARGKFKIKQWGRVKITYELKLKKVSAYCIKQAMKEINEQEYETTLQKLTEKRYESLKSEQYLIRKKKTMDYLQQHGYEFPLINAALIKLKAEKE